MKKTNLGLVEFAKKARDMKAGYVYGTFGQILTPSLLDYKRKQYPYQVERYIDFIKQHYLNKVTYDCVGLIKGYLWTNQNGSVVYNPSQDVSANGMYNMAKVKGTIATMPEIPGLCVHYDGHIGVYIGEGKVVEARGTTSGVVETILAGRGWAHWLECPYVTYLKEGDDSPMLKKGDRGQDVVLLQKQLNINGANLVEDGSFGTETEKAVKTFQTKNSLTVDGIVGVDTTRALIEKTLIKFNALLNDNVSLQERISKIKSAYVSFGDAFL